jgi:hypothetical protein
MLIKTLAAGAALSMLVVGGSAMAQQTKASAQIGPSQPIPYGQLKAYQKASPKARASTNWSASASASTGASVDTSATAPLPSGSQSGDAKASTSMDTSVNPPVNSLPQTPPILPGSATSPEPGSNLPASAPPLDPMTPR